MKNRGTAIRATIVIAWPSRTGCSCISDLTSTVSPNANAKPRTSNSAARYQPGLLSLGGSGTRVRRGRSATGSGATDAVVAISRSPCSHKSASCSGSFLPQSLCHPRVEVDQRLDLGLGQGLRKRLRHEVRLEARRDVGVGLRDRLLDVLLQRQPRLLRVGHDLSPEVGAD